jgi:hypothetical protein
LSSATGRVFSLGGLSRALACAAGRRQDGVMAESNRTAREERLAAKLRENLRRRKDQARASGPEAGRNDGTDAEADQQESAAPLSKQGLSR